MKVMVGCLGLLHLVALCVVCGVVKVMQGVGGGGVSIRPGIGSVWSITLVGQVYLLSFCMAQGTAALLHGDWGVCQWGEAFIFLFIHSTNYFVLMTMTVTHYI